MKERKSISFSDWWAFRECALAWYRIKYLRMRQPETVHQVIGNAVHAVAEHGFDQEAAAAAVERELAKLSADEQATARLEIIKQSDVAQAMDEEDDDDGSRETKFKWFDKKSGWTFVAKPDKVIITEDRWRRQTVEIIDYKTSRFLKRKHKMQAFFFAMVVIRALLSDGTLRPRFRVRIVVRLTGDGQLVNGEWKGKEEVLGYSGYKEDQMLDEVRGSITQMEAYFKAKNFPGNPGWYCDHCPLAESCQAFNTARKQLALATEARAIRTA